MGAQGMQPLIRRGRQGSQHGVRRSLLGGGVGLDCLGIDVKHLLLHVVDLLLDVAQPLVVGVAAILRSLASHFLGTRPAVHAVDLVKDVGAEYLHLARLGRHTHVRAGLAGRIRTFGAVVILRAAEHLNNCFVVGVDKDSG